ncbi:MAG: hypothetical protein WBB23_11850 [Desulforhopalus sp.]
MTSNQLEVIPDNSQVVSRTTDALLDFLGKVPVSTKLKSGNPEQEARSAATAAAVQASLAAGTLALPPGPLGWLTILPEMIAMWKIQAQLVADIAAIYGKTTNLSREQMIFCLFRHSAAQAVRDLVVRVGERVLVKPLSVQGLQKIAQKIGIKVTERTIGKGVSRWLPIVGAVGVAGYAYYDTTQVAKTAIDFFSSNLSIEVDNEEPADSAMAEENLK